MTTKMKHREGFTLLEVLVASVIGAFISLVAVSTLRAVSAGRVRIDENIIAADELRYAAEIIGNDLANLYRDHDVRNMRLIGLTSEATKPASSNLTIRVVSPIKARYQQTEGHLYDVQYSLLQKDGQSLLTRRKVPVVGIETEEQIAGGMLTVIAENIMAFDIRYFDKTQWQDDWPEESEQIPDLMEITLVTIEGDPKAGKPKTMSRNFLVSFPRLLQTDADESSQITDLNNIDSAGSSTDAPSGSGGGR
jgi:type II secretion system protein J